MRGMPESARPGLADLRNDALRVRRVAFGVVSQHTLSRWSYQRRLVVLCELERPDHGQPLAGVVQLLELVVEGVEQAQSTRDVDRAGDERGEDLLLLVHQLELDVAGARS